MGIHHQFKYVSHEFVLNLVKALLKPAQIDPYISKLNSNFSKFIPRFLPAYSRKLVKLFPNFSFARFLDFNYQYLPSKIFVDFIFCIYLLKYLFTRVVILPLLFYRSLRLLFVSISVLYSVVLVLHSFLILLYNLYSFLVFGFFRPFYCSNSSFIYNNTSFIVYSPYPSNWSISSTPINRFVPSDLFNSSSSAPSFLLNTLSSNRVKFNDPFRALRHSRFIVDNLSSHIDLFSGLNFLSTLKLVSFFLKEYVSFLLQLLSLFINGSINLFQLFYLVLFCNHDLLLVSILKLQLDNLVLDFKNDSDVLLCPVYELMEARVFQYFFKHRYSVQSYALQHGAIGNLNLLRMVISPKFLSTINIDLGYDKYLFDSPLVANIASDYISKPCFNVPCLRRSNLTSTTCTAHYPKRILFLGDLHEWVDLLSLACQLAVLRPDLNIFFRPHPKVSQNVTHLFPTLNNLSLLSSDITLSSTILNLNPLISFIGPSGVSLDLAFMKSPFKILRSSSFAFFDNSPLTFLDPDSFLIDSDPRVLSRFISHLSADLRTQITDFNYVQACLHISPLSSDPLGSFLSHFEL